MIFSSAIRTIEQFDAIKHMGFGHFYVPIDVLLSNYKKLEGNDIVITLPAIISDDVWDGYMAKLSECLRLGYGKLQVNNLSQLSQVSRFKLYGGFRLNVFNDVSLKLYEEEGLELIQPSVELTLGQIGHLKHNVPLEVIGYGHIPVMTIENCILKCQCNENVYISDRMGYKFPVVKDAGICRSVILNSNPIVMNDKLADIRNTDIVNLYFTIEQPRDCVLIAKAYFDRKPEPGKKNFTRGHMYKGV